MENNILLDSLFLKNECKLKIIFKQKNIFRNRSWNGVNKTFSSSHALTETKENTIIILKVYLTNFQHHSFNSEIGTRTTIYYVIRLQDRECL